MKDLSLSYFSTIIFDFDGVIGKTMQDNCKAWAFAFDHFKVSFNEQEYYRLEGIKANNVAKHFAPHLEGKWSEIVELKEKHYRDNNRFSFYEGARELLSELAKTKKLALVTGANRERLDYTRSTLSEENNLFKFFNYIVTANDIEFGKPHPDPYLKALKFLNVEAHDALVIENAPLGIESAKGAHLKVVGVTSTLTKEDLKNADWIVPNIKTLLSHLA